MSRDRDIPRIALQVSRGVVVASIQVDLEEDTLRRFQQDLLDRIHATGSRGVILDVSGLETLDAEEFAALRRIVGMARLMGAESLLVGLKPGIVSALLETGADVDGVRAAVNLDAAFALLEPESAGEAAPEGGSEEQDERSSESPSQGEARG